MSKSDKRSGGWIGRSAPRVEDARLVRGAGRFVADIRADDCLHAFFARSDVPHGRIGAIDLSSVRGRPGVVAAFDGGDVADFRPLPVNPLMEGLRVPDTAYLAQHRVRAVGQPVAMIVADSALAAADAAEAASAEIEPLSPVMDGRDAEPIFESVPGNRAAHQRWSSGDVADAFARAAHVVEARVEHPRLAPTALEPRAALAEWHGDGRMTVWLSTQTPHRARADLAQLLGLEPEAIRVVAPDVGGAFGMKASLYPEEFLVAWAARRLGRSVRWTASRTEELLAATQGRGLVTEGALALSEGGEILGLRARIAAPLGYWLPFSAAVPARNAARVLPGPYRAPAAEIEAAAHLSTTAAVGIYRGAGRPEAAMLIERLMDRGARALDDDPLALRRRNLIAPEAMPFETPTGERLDSGDYPAMLDKAKDAAAYDAMVEARARRRAAGEIVGIGTALYIEPTGAGWECAAITLERGGRFVAATGSTAQGQGRETAAAQIVADLLCIDPALVTVRQGDTEATPQGVGALASRSTPIGGGALAQASEELIAKALKVAARLLQAAEASVTLVEGGFEAGNARATWSDIAAQAPTHLMAEAVFTTDGEAWGAGVCIVMLSIEPDTGVPAIERMVWVDDAGTVINPALLEGQLLGGIAQGIGEALMERVVYDSDGQLLTGSLMDYALPRADDMPPIDLDRIVTPSPHNPLGAKGIGEAGTIGAPPAILNAAIDALSPFGVTDLQMPLTSERLWRAIKGLPRREE